MCRALLSLGAAAALPLALANALLCTRLAPALASDPTVAAQLRTVAWPAALSQLSINLATALDGAYIGCGRLGHYVRVMAAASAALGAVFVAAWATGRPGLGAAWTALAVFASVRCVAHLAGLVALRAELVGGKRQPGAVGGRPAR
jgi:Na+-driven multidrug efflux pump